MKKEDLQKQWEMIRDDVEMRVKESYHGVPIGKRRQLGIEPKSDGSFEDVESYDRNRWFVCYLSLLQWKKRCYYMISMDKVFDDD